MTTIGAKLPYIEWQLLFSVDNLDNSIILEI